MIDPTKTNQTNVSRRLFLGAATAAGLGADLSGQAATAEENPSPLRARRPKPPFRVWFQPRLFERDIDLYRNMTIDASGWLDPRLSEAMGKTALNWVYGPQHPWATGPDYWQEACSPKERGKRGSFVSAGIAIDEWVPPKIPEGPKWLAEGLRAGREANPDVFVAVWSTDPTPPLFELTREGTVDLVIVEGYTHVAPEDPANFATSWEVGMRRCQALADAGLTEKTIFSFGHITAGAQRKGEPLTPKWLRDKAEELKRRFPDMPGVAFFQRGEKDAPALRNLVRACDALSGELWPDPGSRKKEESR